jgi:uncharacterized protein YhfF
MSESATVKALWNAYLRSLGEDEAATAKTYTAWHFCSNQADADELAELVRSGRKRATASALPVYEHDGQPLPKVGDLSVILDWKGEARCIIQTTHVAIVPFVDVPEEFAWMEGEGDRSLTYWRAGHQKFFTMELEAIGLVFDLSMPVVCERFELVHKA